MKKDLSSVDINMEEFEKIARVTKNEILEREAKERKKDLKIYKQT